MYDALTDNLIIREWLNGSLLPLSANLAFIILVFLIDSFRYREDKSWWSIDGVPTGCALFWIFMCESMRAGCVWHILRTTNDGRVVPTWLREISNISFVIAAGILAAAILRCIYLFSPPGWQSWFWKFAAVTTIVFLLLSHYFPNIGY